VELEAGADTHRRVLPDRIVAGVLAALVFDLDNCLAAADESGPQVLTPTFDAIRRANRGTLPDDTLARAFDDCWRNPLDWVAAKHGFSPEMLAAGWEVNARAEVTTRMGGYGDLDVLSELPEPRFLVTSGFRRLQESKVRALGIQPYFERVFVDAIDEPDRRGKAGIFRHILGEYGFAPDEVVVLGDSEHSEIAAGNQLGMATVQILRPGVTRATTAAHVVANLAELRALLARAR
jgi:phosphoglycolate phosphatase-like HAD superfamily hydrolase